MTTCFRIVFLGLVAAASALGAWRPPPGEVHIYNRPVARDVEFHEMSKQYLTDIRAMRMHFYERIGPETSRLLGLVETTGTASLELKHRETVKEIKTAYEELVEAAAKGDKAKFEAAWLKLEKAKETLIAENNKGDAKDRIFEFSADGKYWAPKGVLPPSVAVASQPHVTGTHGSSVAEKGRETVGGTVNVDLAATASRVTQKGQGVESVGLSRQAAEFAKTVSPEQSFAAERFLNHLNELLLDPAILAQAKKYPKAREIIEYVIAKAKESPDKALDVATLRNWLTEEGVLASVGDIVSMRKKLEGFWKDLPAIDKQATLGKIWDNLPKDHPLKQVDRAEFVKDAVNGERYFLAVRMNEWFSASEGLHNGIKGARGSEGREMFENWAKGDHDKLKQEIKDALKDKSPELLSALCKMQCVGPVFAEVCSFR